MRTGGILNTLAVALLVSNCGSVTPLPTSPSSAATPAPSTPGGAPSGANQPSLVGAWRGSVGSQAVRAGSDTTVGFALHCSGRWEFSSHTGGHFEGTFSFQGSGPETDWRCTRSGRIAGDLTSDHQVTIVFSPAFVPGGCTNIVGGERATGSRNSDSIVVSVPYSATCEMAMGGLAPRWDLQIAATITLTPW